MSEYSTVERFVEAMRMSKSTGVIVGVVLALSIIATSLAQANPFNLDGGGQGRGTSVIDQNINNDLGLLEDNRFGAKTAVENAQDGRFNLFVKVDGEVATGLVAPRRTCNQPFSRKDAVASNDSVSTECITTDADRLSTATVIGEHAWEDTEMMRVTRFQTTGTA